MASTITTVNKSSGEQQNQNEVGGNFRADNNMPGGDDGKRVDLSNVSARSNFNETAFSILN